MHLTAGERVAAFLFPAINFWYRSALLVEKRHPEKFSHGGGKRQGKE